MMVTSILISDIEPDSSVFIKFKEEDIEVRRDNLAPSLISSRHLTGVREDGLLDIWFSLTFSEIVYLASTPMYCSTEIQPLSENYTAGIPCHHTSERAL